MGIVTRLLNEIDGIYWFPLVSLVIFILLFLVLVIHTLTMSRKRDQELSRMPLDNDEQQEFMNRKH
jgi:cbb3-type cytochrome oxidase subunit 3